MGLQKTIAIVLLVALLAASLIVFYGPDVSAISTIAALLLFPASIGAAISQVTDPKGEQSPMGCFLWPTLGILAAIALVAVFAREGAICIAMILPLWLPAAGAGAIVQYFNRRARLSADFKSDTFNSIAWLALPLVFIPIELSFPQPWETREVSREVILTGSPEKIWPSLTSIERVQPTEGKWNVTQDLLGVPRPVGARLVERNGDLVRLASWQRGIRFEEQIVTSEPNKRMCWRFAFPDRSIQEQTDRHISPDGEFLKIESGCYNLQDIGQGKTRVTLTTTYRMRTRLNGYFAAWGDLLLGDVQSNVLAIIADRNEARRR